MIELLASSLRLATPLLFAAMGGLLCERSGVATICLEGVMLTGAFTAASVTAITQDPHLGVIAALIAGSFMMALHAFLTLYAKADHIVSAVAVNILASGLTPFLCKLLFGSPTNSESLPLELRLRPFEFWPDALAILRQPWLVYLACVLPFLLQFAIYRTRWGLRLLAAGDGPEALSTSGVSVNQVRFIALLWGGALASLGGVYLSISHASQFTRDMTAGRGYIALTALIFGKWRPLPTLIACLFFGFADAVQIRLQSASFLGMTFPVQLIQALPYLVTLIVLVGFVGRARPPLAIGK